MTLTKLESWEHSPSGYYRILWRDPDETDWTPEFTVRTLNEAMLKMSDEANCDCSAHKVISAENSRWR